eukprot:gene3771-7482_t
MLSWTFIENTDEKEMTIYAAICSKNFQYSLIVSVSSSSPMVLDFVLDIYRLFNDQEKIKHGFFTDSLLISSLFLPDLMILLYAIPLNSPQLLNVANLYSKLTEC